jgi:hypothetical protein
MKVKEGDGVSFKKVIKGNGVIQRVIYPDTADEKYIVIQADGSQYVITPNDVIDTIVMLRRKGSKRYKKDVVIW